MVRIHDRPSAPALHTCGAGFVFGLRTPRTMRPDAAHGHLWRVVRHGRQAADRPAQDRRRPPLPAHLDRPQRGQRDHGAHPGLDPSAADDARPAQLGRRGARRHGRARRHHRAARQHVLRADHPHAPRPASSRSTRGRATPSRWPYAPTRRSSRPITSSPSRPSSSTSPSPRSRRSSRTSGASSTTSSPRTSAPTPDGAAAAQGAAVPAAAALRRADSRVVSSSSERKNSRAASSPSGPRFARSDVAEHPVLAALVDHVVAVLLLVGVQLLHHREALVERVDDREVVLGDLVAELLDDGVGALIGHGRQCRPPR